MEGNKENSNQPVDSKPKVQNSVNMPQPTVEQPQNISKTQNTTPLTDNSPDKLHEDEKTSVWPIIITMLFLLTFTPIGIILMFLITKWPIWIKATILVLFLFLLGVYAFFFIRFLNDAKVSREKDETLRLCVEECAKNKIMQGIDSDEDMTICLGE